jgi:hypothetical protein
MPLREPEGGGVGLATPPFFFRILSPSKGSQSHRDAMRKQREQGRKAGPRGTRLLALVTLLLWATGAAPSPPISNWVDEVEAARGLPFVRPPSIVWVNAKESSASSREPVGENTPIECPAPGFTTQPVTNAWTDPAADQVMAREGARALEVKVALARLLDAQHYPGLVEEAATLPGDAGLTLRALLAASACASAQGGFGPAPPQPSGDPFTEPTVEVKEPGAGAPLVRTPMLAAHTFLQQQPDREAVFRRPPRSTAELLMPARWARGEGPWRLVGEAPKQRSCDVARDESLGVFAYAEALVKRGGRVPSAIFTGWEGDRLIRFRCGDGSQPWVYVAQFAREPDADAFAAAAARLLPADLARPLEARSDGRRAVAWHALPAATTLSFAASLDAEPSL